MTARADLEALDAEDPLAPLRDRFHLPEGVIYLVSPLDSHNQTEVEISEEQEDWLRWMVQNQVQRIRLQ